MSIDEHTKKLHHFRKKIDSVARALYVRATRLIQPTSLDEDLRRQELILNIILTISILFLITLDLMVGYNSLTIPWYYGVDFSIFSLVVFGFMMMLSASKRGHARAVSFILIGIFVIGSTFGGWFWGASLPATLLMFALISALSGILIGTRFGLTMSCILVIILSILGYHEIHILGVQSWKYETINTTDIILYGAIILFISCISWLSNRELDRSLRRARQSEKELAHERDILETKVSERTAELKKSQIERVTELSRIAEFGRLSQGLFHDLMTPLTSVALHVEHLYSIESKDDTAEKETMPLRLNNIREADMYVKKAINASKRMSEFMKNIRGHIQSDNKGSGLVEAVYDSSCNIADEASMVIDLLAYKARQAGVKLILLSEKNTVYPAHPFHIHQLLINLVSNAIEAHENSDNTIECDTKEKTVTITIQPKMISVSDNGAGMTNDVVQKIFDPFFTTKPSHRGTGIGLFTVKKIVEESLRGKITVETYIGKGTTFSIKLPAIAK